MAKQKVRKAAVKGTRRAAPKPKHNLKPPGYPKTELHELFTKSGKLTIQGIDFDLRPAELVQKGLLPSLLQYGIDPFQDAGLAMPWDGPSSAVRRGDVVKAQHIKILTYGHEFDHESDQNTAAVQFAVYRKGRKLKLDLSLVEFTRSGTSIWIFDAPIAFERLAKLSALSSPPSCKVGDLLSDPNIYGPDNFQRASEIASDEMNPRMRALTGAFTTNWAWSQTVLLSRTISGKKTQKNVSSLLDRVEISIDNAVALGYWLAKLEMEPKIGSALRGIARTKKVTKTISDKANDRWRNKGLALAIAERKKTPSISQTKLAELLKKLLPAASYAPSAVRIAETIADWEKVGHLERSTRNPRQ